MYPGATHISVLAACIAYTDGPVLEVGCGENSTPFLHYLCKNRLLVSLENYLPWIQGFEEFNTGSHKVIYVPDYAGCHLIDDPWDVVFIDHAPALRRKEDIKRVADKAKLVVVHDTECPDYRYEEVYPMFKYHLPYKRYAVWTSILSNHIDPALVMNQ